MQRHAGEAMRRVACQPCVAQNGRPLIRGPQAVLSSASAAPSRRGNRGTPGSRHRLQFFRVYENASSAMEFGLSEQLHQPAVLLDQIVRQHRHADAALAGAHDLEHVVDGERRRARTLAVACDLDEPAPVLKWLGTTVPPSNRSACLSRSSSVRGVPNRLRYSGDA